MGSNLERHACQRHLLHLTSVPVYGYSRDKTQAVRVRRQKRLVYVRASIEWEFEVKSPTEWTSPNHVSISLWNGEALVSVISEQALNTGRFAWVVDDRMDK